MKRYPKIYATVLALVVGMGLLWSAPAPASAEELYRESAEVNLMLTKLGRGAANILTGWLEVPKQMAQSIRQTDPVTGSIVGLVRGIGWTYARTVTGAYEVLTFPFPTPKNYAPLIEPEFIVKSIWGEPLPIIADPHNNWAEPRVPDYGTGEPIRTEPCDP